MEINIPKEPKEHKIQLNKKLSNAIAALTKAENKQWDQLIQQEPSCNMFAFHFGSGSEDDYNTLSKFLVQFGQFKLSLYPVKNYAFVEFAQLEHAQQLMAVLAVSKENPNLHYTPLMYLNKERPTMFFYSRVAHQDLGLALIADIPNASYDVQIPGLTLIKEFITEEQEQAIMEQIEQNEWSRLQQRRVQHYGYDFLYGANTVDMNKPADKPIPEFLKPVIQKIDEIFDGKQKTVDQLTINEYHPGMGIPPHFDVHPPFEDKFVSISLLGGIVMTFKSSRGEEKHLYLPSRSCVVFDGEARYSWFHSIAARKMDRVEGDSKFRKRRVSLTFRTIRPSLKCHCDWPLFCASQGYDPISRTNPLLQKPTVFPQSSRNVEGPSEEEIKMIQGVEGGEHCTPTEIEKKYVYEIYEKIAPHFSSTRYKAWPQIEKFLDVKTNHIKILQSLESGSFVGDIGCGNGKYLHVNRQNIEMIGTDRSENLLKICRQRDEQYQVFSADSLKLPLRNQCFDAVISIAVIHHFSNRSLRIAAIKELKRIAKVGGQILIYVWAYEQEEKVFKEQDVFVPWNLQFKFEDASKLKSEEESKTQQVGVDDYQINESKKTVVYKRYYHMFMKGEIEDLVKEVDGLEVQKSLYDHANWVVTIRRKH